MTFSVCGSLSSPTCWWGWVTGFSTEPQHSSRPSAPVPSPSPNPTDTPTQHPFQNSSLKIWHRNQSLHSPPRRSDWTSAKRTVLQWIDKYTSLSFETYHLKSFYLIRHKKNGLSIHFLPSWSWRLWYWWKHLQLRGIDPSDAVILQRD